MKIISYNVNGIRAAVNKGFIEWLKAVDPEMLYVYKRLKL